MVPTKRRRSPRKSPLCSSQERRRTYHLTENDHSYRSFALESESSGHKFFRFFFENPVMEINPLRE